MFRWLSRAGSSRSVKAGGLGRAAVAEMQRGAAGRLPAGGGGSAPAPEYIEQAAEPSDDLWAREREFYRLKQERGEG